MDKKQEEGFVVITSQLVKAYLDEKYRKGEESTYTRVGGEIISFVNRWLVNSIKLIKTVSHKRNTENVQMPHESMVAIARFLEKKLEELKQKKQTLELKKKLSKVLGK